MTSLRKRKAAISRLSLRRRTDSIPEGQLLDRLEPVGREFGSPDFERLMDEDQRDRAGVFDPSLKELLGLRVQVPEDSPVRHKRPL
jgi:hypothetical protein